MSAKWTDDLMARLIGRNDKAVANAIKLIVDGQLHGDDPDRDFLNSVRHALPRYHDHMTERQLARARKILARYLPQLCARANQRPLPQNAPKGRFLELAKGPEGVNHPLYGLF